MNTKDIGNIGLGEAIAYFTGAMMTVSVPLNDSQPYDLIVDDGKSLLTRVWLGSIPRDGTRTSR
jgi:hypothetical protein